MLKHVLAISAVFAATATIAQPSIKQAGKFAATITAEDLKKHLTIVASAEMEGRETGTPGEYKAAAYIIEQMKQIGLQPGNNGQWLQPYNIYRDSLTEASLEVNGTPFQMFKDFSATASNFNSHMAFGEVVYVNLNDSLWKNNKVDVNGRIVLVRFKAPTAPPAGGNMRMMGGFGAGALANQLGAKGAAAVLVVGDRINTNAKEPVMSNMTTNKYPVRQSANTFTISEDVAAKILGADAAAEKSGTLTSKTVKAPVAFSYHEKTINLVSNNVLGFLEGGDLKDQFLVVTGHYDHIGRRGDVINYGADDDGSGTVGVLEVAEAFAKAKAAGKGPRRSILFMTVSGEEKGLWGSAFYAANPVYPLDKTTADLNIDMIGRTDTIYEKKKDSALYLYVVGEDKLSSELPLISATANKNTKLVIDQRYNDPNDKERIYFRSDHYNFAKNGVPILFYFDGIHRDYHRPTDTVDKIEFPLMAKRAQLVFFTAWDIANRNEMLKRDKPLPASAISR
ncbi:MAG TPA: M28 family peptidase [Phnomibacter sp.]|nr:M28 family peptidase [Phnomibacter sp.]